MKRKLKILMIFVVAKLLENFWNLIRTDINRELNS